MAKNTSRKNRRQRKPNVPRQTGPAEQAVKKAPVESKSAAPAMTGSMTVNKAVDFATEYHYVLADLRNMAIVSALMLALLLVLNFTI